MTTAEAIDLARTLIRTPNRGALTQHTLERLDGPNAVREALQVIETEIHSGCRTNPLTFPVARDVLKADLQRAEEDYD